MKEFRHVRQGFDHHLNMQVATIMPGEHFVSEKSIAVCTVLGSCVSACIRDPVIKVGGMNHFMLPSPNENSKYCSWGESGRYGNYAMEMLINDIMKRGGKKRGLKSRYMAVPGLMKATLKLGKTIRAGFWIISGRKNYLFLIRIWKIFFLGKFIIL